MMSRLSKKDERGIAAVIVAISLAALFGALLLSVDAGNLWQTRRNLITATDATALDRAREAALNGSSTACSSSWTSLLTSNGGSDVSPLACSTTGTNDTGYVAIE